MPIVGDLDRLISESEAFCARYSKIDPPKDEHEAQIRREIEIFRLRSPAEQNAILDLRATTSRARQAMPGPAASQTIIEARS
jgi:hypothetical protein